MGIAVEFVSLVLQDDVFISKSAVLPLLLEKGLKRKAAESLVEDSLQLADAIITSGLMASVSWERKEYLSAKKHILERTSRRGYCYSVEDILDGYFMHDPRCPHWPSGAFGGHGCIKN